MTSDDRLRELEDKYEGFKVYDNRGEKIGKVDDLFIDDSDREEYVGVKMGLFGSKSTLVPMDIVRVNESDKTLEVSESKDRVKDAPTFDDDEDITPDFEDRIRSHFGLESMGSDSDRGSYDSYSGATGGASGTNDQREEDSGEGTTGQSGSSTSDTSVTNNRDVETTSADGGRGQDSDEGTTSQSGSSTSDRSGGRTSSGGDAAETGEKESWDFEETRAADGGGSSESSASQDSETREIPIGRETTETETFQEGGRTKIRRRIRREEIEIVDEDPNR